MANLGPVGGGSQADRHGPLRTGQFRVEIDEVRVPGWQSVKIPGCSMEEGEYRDGEDTEGGKKLWGQPVYDDLEMERGVQPGERQIINWLEEVKKGDLEKGRKTVAVILMDERGRPQVRWEFQDAWIKDYDPPQLDANADGEVATESIVVAFDEMTRKRH